MDSHRSTLIASQGQIRTVRLEDDQLSALLDRLTDEEVKREAGAKSAHERFPYRHKALKIEVWQQGGTTSTFLVPTRSISREGMAFVHNGFIHIGTKCRMELITTHNMWQTVDGKIDRCNYVEGRFHDVGIKFDNPIDVATFSAQAVPKRILVADDDPAIQRLLQFHLEQLHAKVSLVSDGAAAVEQATKNLFDCLLMDIDMPVMDGLTAIKHLRDHGFSGKVVAITAYTNAGDEDRMLQAGFNGYIKKPVTKQTLAKLLESLDDEPIFSTMGGDPGMIELINRFVEELAGKCREIERAAIQGTPEDVERFARRLKGEAGGYGFEPITDAARELEEAARQKSPQQEIRKQVAALSKLCTLARPIGG